MSPICQEVPLSTRKQSSAYQPDKSSDDSYSFVSGWFLTITLTKESVHEMHYLHLWMFFFFFFFLLFFFVVDVDKPYRSSPSNNPLAEVRLAIVHMLMFVVFFVFFIYKFFFLFFAKRKETINGISCSKKHHNTHLVRDKVDKIFIVSAGKFH